MILVLLSGIGLLLLIILVVMPAFKVAPFAYPAARLRASRAQFLRQDELHTLAHLGYHDVLVALDEKKHLELTSLVTSSFPEEKVQRKIRQYRLTNLSRLVAYTPSKYKPFFKVILSRETLEFIIAAIRSKQNKGFTSEILSSMFTDKKFSVSDFDKLSMEDLLSQLEKTGYGQTVTKFRADILDGELEEFEAELNREYYKRLHAASNHAILRSCARRVVDLHNIKQALCFIQFTPINGGSLSLEVMTALQAASSLEDIKKALEETYVHEFIKDGSSVQQMYQGLYRSFQSYADQLAIRQPLSLNQMIAFYVANIVEIKNMRILLKLTHAKFPTTEIEEAFI